MATHSKAGGAAHLTVALAAGALGPAGGLARPGMRMSSSSDSELLSSSLLVPSSLLEGICPAVLGCRQTRQESRRGSLLELQPLGIASHDAGDVSLETQCP